MTSFRWAMFGAAILAGAAGTGCPEGSGESPTVGLETPTPQAATATAAPTPTATDIPTPTATDIPTPEGTPTPTATAIPTPEGTPTATAIPTPEGTPTPAVTDIPTPTATDIPTPAATDIPTATAAPTATATAAPTPTATATATAAPTPTATAAPTPTATAAPTPTATAAPTPTATAAPTPTATREPTPTATDIPTPTATAIPTPTATAIPTPTATRAPTPTPTREPTPTPFPLAASCAALVGTDADVGDGPYTLDPHGDGQTLEVWCDMSTDGGGWTLAMRFSPESVFTFYHPQWTAEGAFGSSDILNPADHSDAQFLAWDQVVGGEIRGCLQDLTTGDYGCKAYSLPAATTLLALFTDTPVGSDANGLGLYFEESRAERMEWLTMWGRSESESSLSNGYVTTGINVDDDLSCWDARVRFGLGLNNESNISSLNDTAGFGASAYNTSTCENDQSAWRIGAGFAAGANLIRTAGHIWVR